MDVVSADDVASGDEETPSGLDLTPRQPPTGRSRPGGQRRWPWFVAIALIVVAIGFVISKAISDASLFFYNADEAIEMREELGDRRFRLQGSVVGDTTVRTADGVAFTVAFNGVEVPIEHRGDPPDMFTDQIPVVLEGRWAQVGDQSVFDSDYMLVKHGNEYIADNSDRLKDAEEGGYEPGAEPAPIP